MHPVNRRVRDNPPYHWVSHLFEVVSVYLDEPASGICYVQRWRGGNGREARIPSAARSGGWPASRSLQILTADDGLPVMALREGWLAQP
jgi:hypothetical protein